jgi:ribosomal-protein-alanine N-acetyltransferase
MSEALQAILDFGFDTMQLNRVEALSFPQNTASRQLLAKLGFAEEGVLREYEFLKDRAQDMAIYSLLSRERRP